MPPELPSTPAAVTAGYRRLDNVAGAAFVRKAVVGHYHRIVRYLGLAGGEAEYRALAGADADAADLVAFLAVDAERRGEAARWYRRSAELAEAGGNGGLRAYTLNCTCRLLSDCGEHRDALDFAERAESVARREAPARTRSCVRTTRAYVHACLGDVSGCLRDLDEARTLLTRAGRAGDEPWLDNWHSEAFVAKREGYCRLRLGQSEPAREVFRQSLALWDPTLARQRAEVAVALADALVQAGEIPEACELAGEAHEVAVTMESARIQRKVAALRTVLEPWKSDPAVRRLDERMRAARSAAR